MRMLCAWNLGCKKALSFGNRVSTRSMKITRLHVGLILNFKYAKLQLQRMILYYPSVFIIAENDSAILICVHLCPSVVWSCCDENHPISRAFFLPEFVHSIPAKADSAFGRNKNRRNYRYDFSDIFITPAIVSYGYRRIFAGNKPFIIGAIDLVQNNIFRFDRHIAHVGDGVSGVHAEIRQNLVDLGRIDFDRPHVRDGNPCQIEVFSINRRSILSMLSTESFRSSTFFGEYPSFSSMLDAISLWLSISATMRIFSAFPI